MDGQSAKSHILNVQSDLSRWEFFACLGILIVATYLLAPRFWEPGAESWKNWVSARILRETRGFTVLNLGPLYSIYLQLFLFLDYPLSLNLEHVLTRLFAYVALFLLLRKFFSSVPALLLACAWIPMLWMVEAGSRVMGIGFLALYLGESQQVPVSGGYLPASLVAAALCDLAYAPFLLGHVVGVVIERWSDREPLLGWPHPLTVVRSRLFPAIVSSGLVLLAILAIFFQSPRPDNNMHAFYYPWAPVSQTNALTASFFQFGNWKYVMQNVPGSDWIFQDWYFTNWEVFGGASNLLQAALRRPAFFLGIILDNIYFAAISFPFQFIFGFRFPARDGLALGSWIMMIIGSYGLYKNCIANKLRSHFYAIVFGSIGVITALSLVVFSNRFVSVLLPVALILIVHIPAGFESLLNLVRSCRLFNNSVAGDGRGRGKVYGIFGWLLLLLGLGVIAKEGGLQAWFWWFYILLIEIVLIAAGALLIIKQQFFSGDLKERENSRIKAVQFWFSNAVIPVLAIGILVTAYNPSGQGAFAADLLGWRYILAGDKPVSMVAVHKQLLASVNQKTKVLALEAPWISSFADVNLDNVYHPLALPPFKDSSGETARLLNSLDVIWVSYGFANRAPSIGTQQYLRYLLHVEPFLENALTRGWTVQDVEGFGKIYRKLHHA